MGSGSRGRFTVALARPLAVLHHLEHRLMTSVHEQCEAWNLALSDYARCCPWRYAHTYTMIHENCSQHLLGVLIAAYKYQLWTILCPCHNHSPVAFFPNQ